MRNLKSWTKVASLNVAVGLLFGLAISGCGGSSSDDTASLTYKYDIAKAKTSLPAAVSTIEFTGNVDGYKCESKAANEVEITGVPLKTTEIVAVYKDAKNKVIGYGLNTFSGLKAEKNVVETPGYVESSKVSECLKLTAEPANTVIKVNGTVTYKVTAKYTDPTSKAVMNADISTDKAVKYTPVDAKIAVAKDAKKPNVFTGLAFGKTSIDISYEFFGTNLTTAATINVLDGEFVSLAIRPVDKKIKITAANEIVLTNMYVGKTATSPENTFDEAYENEGFAVQSCEFTADAYYKQADGNEKVVENVECAYAMKSGEATGKPFSFDPETRIVTLAPTAAAGDTDTITATYLDPISNKEKTDDQVLVAYETDLQITPTNVTPEDHFDKNLKLFKVYKDAPTSIKAFEILAGFKVGQSAAMQYISETKGNLSDITAIKPNANGNVKAVKAQDGAEWTLSTESSGFDSETIIFQAFGIEKDDYSIIDT